MTPKQHWVDSVYQSLPLEKKIAQLYMAIAHTESNLPHVEKLVYELGIGGICFMQGDPLTHVKCINTFQEKTQVPLWFSMDAEWGLGMRLPSVQNLPRAMTLGAVQDTALVYQVGQTIGKQLKRMGIHINFAPVLDINSNPNNPVINYRSFGENKYRVTQMGAMLLQGMQEQGVIACVKHFPGHGNTAEDSHVSLPVVHQTREQLEDIELYPFQQLIAQGLKAVMTAHLSVPSLDPKPQSPSSLSSKIVSDYLIKKMGFNGLIFTDGLNMASVTKLYSSPALDYKSFMAGNDVLLFSKNTDLGIDTLRKRFIAGDFTEERLARSVKKILGAKYDLGLWKKQVIDTVHLIEDLNNQLDTLRARVADKAMTCVNDQHEIIQAIRSSSWKEVTIVALNQKQSLLELELIKRGAANSLQPTAYQGAAREQVMEKIRKAPIALVCVNAMNQSASKNFGLDSSRIVLLQQLSTMPNTLIVFFGNPYVLKHFCNIQGAVIAYDEEKETQEAVLNMLQGKFNPEGRLPVSPCATLREGHAYRSALWKTP